MANIVVLPRIEIDNPFSELSEILKNEAIPMIRQLAMNKEQIAILSDTELTDHIPILKRFAPELLTQDGKIDWNKVEEYLKSDDLFKQEVANYLINTRRRREEFRNLPIGAKLEKMREYGAKTNPQILKKEFMRHIILNKYQEAINNSNLPEEAKLFLLAHAPQFAELTVKNPAYFNAFLSIVARYNKKQDETKQESGTGSWRLSLDEEGQRKWGIKLEEPQLAPLQINPPQMPKVAEQKPVGKQRSVKQSDKQRSDKVVKQNTKVEQTLQRTSQNLPFDPNYRPRTPGLLSAPDLTDLLTLGSGFALGVGAKWLASKARNVAGKVAGKVKGVVSKTPKQQTTENVAKETARNVASRRTDIYSRKDVVKEVEEKIRKKMEEDVRQKIQKEKAENLTKRDVPKIYRVDKPQAQPLTKLSPKLEKTPEQISFSSVERTTTKSPLADLDKLPRVKIAGSQKEVVFVRKPPSPPKDQYFYAKHTTTPKKVEMLYYTPSQFERVPVIKYAREARKEKLPAPTPKETRWEFANAKPPAPAVIETRWQFGSRTGKAKPPAFAPKETSISSIPKETPYKETVAREGFKTSQILEEFLKKEQPKVQTKEAVLEPIRKVRNLIKEIPEEAKKDPEVRAKLVEIARELKKISTQAPFRDVSSDLRVLDAKADELKALLRRLYGETKTITEPPPPPPPPKPPKSNKLRKKKSDK
jgi:hypothetical protein